MSEKLEFDREDMDYWAQQEINRVLKNLLRNLTEVRNQQAQGTAADRNGVVDGLNIAISAVRRRIR